MQNKKPSVAVLLAAYNGTEWIEDQLNSIQIQDDVNVKIFISVDHSDDHTESWCMSYAKLHPEVEILPDAGQYGGAARNFFRLIKDVDFSRYEYISFADQDDVWYPWKLSRAISILDKGQYDGYSSNVVAFWPDGRRMLVHKAARQVKWDYLFEAGGPGCTYVLTRSLADAFKNSLIAKWDTAQEVGLHDWYCYAYARCNGYQWHIDPEPSMEYRQHASNQVGVNSGLRALVSRFRRIRDGWWGSQVLLIAELIEDKSPVLALRHCSKRMMFLKLVRWANYCRRRPRDKLLFVFACLAAALAKKRTT